MLRNLKLFRPRKGEDDESVESAAPGVAPRLLLAVLALGVTSLFAGLIWMVYARGETAAMPIVVKAPEGPAKIKPDDEGGMEVPYRDKLVFSRLTGEPMPAADRLRSSIETAPERPEVPKLEPVAVAALDVVGGMRGVTDEGASAADTGASGRLPADKWAIQVAAFNQRRYAVAWLFRTQEQYPEVFGGLDDDVVEGMKNRIRYYRVRFGPFADYAAAKAKCEEVRAVDLNCITVAPETEQE